MGARTALPSRTNLRSVGSHTDSTASSSVANHSLVRDPKMGFVSCQSPSNLPKQD